MLLMLFGLMLLVCIGIPLLYAWRLLRLDVSSRAAWLLVAAEATAIAALVLLVGRWDIAGYYTRFVIAALFAGALIRSLWRHASRPWTDGARPVRRTHRTTMVWLVVFAGALAYVAYGLLPAREARELAFPLRDGRFMVGQGGGVTLLNRHAGHRAQRYAADIVALGDLGFSADRLAPQSLDSYEIYGARVVSPCAGEVVATRDDLPDLIPPRADRDHPRGNHAIVDCGAFHVELAHLRPNSVAVAAGQSVATGDALGRVGNSGNTTEPHLHVHAVDPATGEGLPMSFGGRMPVRNRVYGN